MEMTEKAADDLTGPEAAELTLGDMLILNAGDAYEHALAGWPEITEDVDRVEAAAGVVLLREVYGNPFRPVLLNSYPQVP
jgi:hypothetical protein